MAAQDSTEPEPGPVEDPVLEEGHPSVVGAAGHEPAGRWEQGSERELIAPHGLGREPGCAHAGALSPRAARARPSASFFMSSTSSGNGRVAALGRATSTISISGTIPARTWR